MLQPRSSRSAGAPKFPRGRGRNESGHRSGSALLGARPPPRLARDREKLERSPIADLVLWQRSAVPFWERLRPAAPFGNGRGWGVETPDSRLIPTFDCLVLWASQTGIPWDVGPRLSLSPLQCPFSATCCKRNRSFFRKLFFWSKWRVGWVVCF